MERLSERDFTKTWLLKIGEIEPVHAKAIIESSLQSITDYNNFDQSFEAQRELFEEGLIKHLHRNFERTYPKQYREMNILSGVMFLATMSEAETRHPDYSLMTDPDFDPADTSEAEVFRRSFLVGQHVLDTHMQQDYELIAKHPKPLPHLKFLRHLVTTELTAPNSAEFAYELRERLFLSRYEAYRDSWDPLLREYGLPLGTNYVHLKEAKSGLMYAVLTAQRRYQKDVRRHNRKIDRQYERALDKG